MSSGADLFVVCKQCGSEVSPYITECPYCGNRLRRRAPKLPRAQAADPRAAGRSWPGSLRRRRVASGLREAPAPVGYGSGRWETVRPYATLALVAAGAGTWVAWHAWPPLASKLAVIGPLGGDWWRLLSNGFIYTDGLYAAITLMSIALFGWLLERRHGPAVVLALFFGATVGGALVALAVYRLPLLTGGNAGALALLAAWAAPDLRMARAGGYYEGDLLGACAVAALLLALPFVEGTGVSLVLPAADVGAVLPFSDSSWLAGVCGAALGLLAGLGLARPLPAEA